MVVQEWNAFLSTDKSIRLAADRKRPFRLAKPPGNPRLCEAGMRGGNGNC